MSATAPGSYRWVFGGAVAFFFFRALFSRIFDSVRGLCDPRTATSGDVLCENCCRLAEGCSQSGRHVLHRRGSIVLVGYFALTASFV